MSSGYNRGASTVPAQQRKVRQPRGPRQPGTAGRMASATGEKIADIWKSGWKGKVGLGVGVLAVWSGLTMDRSFVPGHDALVLKEVPSPPDVGDFIGKKVASGMAWLDGHKSDADKNTVVITVPSNVDIAGTATPPTTNTGTESTTPGGFGSESSAQSTPQTAPYPTLPTVPPTAEAQTPPATASDLESLLPNPMNYSAAAGSVACTGNVVAVTITPDGGFPLKQLANATGEGWDVSAINGPNPADDALFSEVLASRQDNGDGTYNVYVRTGCTGLEQ